MHQNHIFEQDQDIQFDKNSPPNQPLTLETTSINGQEIPPNILATSPFDDSIDVIFEDCINPKSIWRQITETTPIEVIKTIDPESLQTQVSSNSEQYVESGNDTITAEREIEPIFTIQVPTNHCIYADASLMHQAQALLLASIDASSTDGSMIAEDKSIRQKIKGEQQKFRLVTTRIYAPFPFFSSHILSLEYLL